MSSSIMNIRIGSNVQGHSRPLDKYKLYAGHRHLRDEEHVVKSLARYLRSVTKNVRAARMSHEQQRVKAHWP
jgi:hypothetical protein